jgi:hypothetical protein
MKAACAALVTSAPSLASSSRAGRQPFLVGLFVDGRFCGLARPSGPNRRSATNVTVDGGILRLEINRTRRGWTCPEIEVPRSFGYGRYRFVVTSDLTQLDPRIVLGLLTSAGERPTPTSTEWAAAEPSLEVRPWRAGPGPD